MLGLLQPADGLVAHAGQRCQLTLRKPKGLPALENLPAHQHGKRFERRIIAAPIRDRQTWSGAVIRIHGSSLVNVFAVSYLFDHDSLLRWAENETVSAGADAVA